MAQHFKLVSEFQAISRRPFELADPSTLKPTNARPLVEGEFLQLDASYKMARGGDNNAATADGAAVPSYAYFAEQGRYDTQTLQKGPFLYMGSYEADTLIMDATGLSVGDPLMVGDVDVGGIVRRGLRAVVGSEHVVGHVTRLPANNGGYLRFMRTDA